MFSRCVLSVTIAMFSVQIVSAVNNSSTGPKQVDEHEDTPPRTPNVIVIFCDDLGYGDLGCYGSQKHRTPNLDAAAASGMKFTSFYSAAPVCTPSRAALLTGCYPRRVNLDFGWDFLVLCPGDPKGLNPDEFTIAELLRARGYATACIGKWHLGDQLEFLPTRQGFDSYFGIPYSNDQGTRSGKDWPAMPLMRNDQVIEAPAVQDSLTRRYTEAAIEFLQEYRDRPFFLYLPHTFPHDPLHASARFRGKSDNGIYGDAVEEIDWSTGEILKELEKLGLDRQTLVVFTSDNGAAHNYGGSNLPLRGHKASTWEGGMRVPCIMRWPGTIPAGATRDELVTTMDLLPTFATLAGAKMPADRAMDGKDVGPLLRGEANTNSPHDCFYYYRARDLQAVRAGKWKLHVSTTSDSDPFTASALYDLNADISETNDLAAAHPEITEELLALAEQSRTDLGHANTLGRDQRPAGMVEHPTLRLKN